MITAVLTRSHQRVRELAPGFAVSAMVAAAASFLSEHYGAPVMLFALLLGMALNFCPPKASASPASNTRRAPCCGWASPCLACA